MPDDTRPTAQPVPDDQAKLGWLERCKNVLSLVDRQFHFFVSLPVITVLGSILTGHFQYLSAYQDKVNTIATHQISTAETTYVDVSTQFSKAITLQQYLFFNYRDAIHANTAGDDRALETKNARAIFQQYDDLRIALRENIDLLARKVELALDWHSDLDRDPAHATTIGADPVSRIALGAYDFECEGDGPMPSFSPGRTHAELPPPQEMLAYNPQAKPLGLDWYSAKHQLLTLYYCFEVAHRRIVAARQWAGNSTVDGPAKEKFVRNIEAIQESFNREAMRLNSFMILAARRIEIIQVKFRPRGWYCHVPIVREIVDTSGKICTPIRTAQN